MKPILDIQNLSKVYASGKEALKNVSLSLQSGEFIALLGPNGAGKSTLINVLAGNVQKTAGKIFINQFDLDSQELETKNQIGIIPQEISFDPFFTVNEVLLHQSGYFGIQNNQKFIDELLHDLSLFDKKHAKTRSLSGGMKRRLLIAKALVHNPEIIVLDEPTAGVDIELRNQLYVFLKKLHKVGKTIILTTHYLQEAEELCDRIVVINQGKIVADDSKAALKKSFGNISLIEFVFETPIKKEDFAFLEEFSFEVEKTTLKVQIAPENTAKLFAKLAHRNISYLSVKTHDVDLEDVFLKLVA